MPVTAAMIRRVVFAQLTTRRATMKLFAAMRAGYDSLVRKLHIAFVGFHDAGRIFVYEKLKLAVCVMDYKLSLIRSVE